MKIPHKSATLMSILLAPGVFITLTVSLGFSSILIGYKYQTAKSSLIQEHQNIQNHFAKRIHQDILLGNQPSIHQACKDLFEGSKLLSLQVEAANGFKYCSIKAEGLNSDWNHLASNRILFGQSQIEAATINSVFDLSPLRQQIVDYSIFSATLSLVIIVLHLSLYFFLAQSVGRPLKRLAIALDDTSLREVSELQPDADSLIEIKEISYLRSKTKEFAGRIISYQHQAIEEAKTNERFRIARQVAHDIQSPLTALKVVSRSLDFNDESKTLLLKMAIERINEISLDLLNKNNDSKKSSETKSTLKALISEIIEEKRLQNENIEFLVHKEIESLNGILPPHVSDSDFKRVLSNLVQNAIEALENKKTIEVGASQKEKGEVIFIKDYGKGIAPEHLMRIGEEGFSIGKSNTSSGSGLGIFAAKKLVEKWGGDLKFESQINRGTLVSLKLP